MILPLNLFASSACLFKYPSGLACFLPVLLCDLCAPALRVLCVNSLSFQIDVACAKFDLTMLFSRYSSSPDRSTLLATRHFAHGTCL